MNRYTVTLTTASGKRNFETTARNGMEAALRVLFGVTERGPIRIVAKPRY